MVEQVFPNIFRMEIPIPHSPLKSINSYVIKGDQRFLIIDTGMNQPQCRKAMASALMELDVDLKRTDFFITHLHADHLGLVPEFAVKSTKIYFNYPDEKSMKSSSYWNEIDVTSLANGLSEKELMSAMQELPGRKIQNQSLLDFTPLKEGDRLSIGEYVFQCVETPGHTQGHLCLYEKRTKIFFSGDHILQDITPMVSIWGYDGNPLNEYLKSLNKINLFDISCIFPGHRQIFTDYRKRIDELRKHHEIRTEEILTILKSGSKNAYQVASQMTWNIDCNRWEVFPPLQKWFASGEALAHLQYLHASNRLKKEIVKGKVFFSLL